MKSPIPAPLQNRRDFLSAATFAAAWSAAAWQKEPLRNLLDLHQHTRYKGRPDSALRAHQRRFDVKTTVLLPGDGWMLSALGGSEICAEVAGQDPARFVRFACTDPRNPDAIARMSRELEQGAIGIGEMKFQVAVDSPEMLRVFGLARDFQVPVLIHFEHEKYNLGMERFKTVLEMFPTVSFIGHAQTWWGHISQDLDPRELYPAGKVEPGGLTDRLLADYPNVFADLSAGSGLNAISRDPVFSRGFLERHRHKLIWGSDCDCHDGHGAGVARGNCIAEGSLSQLQRLVTDDALLKSILYDNGRRVLSLKS